MDLRIGVLGPLVVEREGRELRLERAAWRRTLLVLVAARGRLVRDDALIEAVFADPAPSAPRTLRTYVSHLRRHLGAATIRRDGPGYRLELSTGHLDAEVFETALGRATTAFGAGDAAKTVRTLEAALASWRGPAFVELADVDPVRVEAARLDELRLDATERWLEARLVAGDAEVVADARAFATDNPLRERAWVLTLRALADRGRHHEASELYREVRARLVEELGTDPGPLLQAEHARLLGIGGAATAEPPVAMPAGTSLAPRGVSPPRPRDRFVGRTSLTDEVRDRLADHRLVTLLGPGGSGKTRTALEVAAGFGGEVRFADLAAVADPDQVPDAVRTAAGAVVARGLGAVEAAALALATVDLLLLDNAEHLVEAVAGVVDELLQRAPRIRVLCTSRTPLQVAGERRLEVPPLALPDDPAGAADSDAVRLLAARAEDAGRPLQLDGATLPAAVAVCERLDGMPLAIELAAARLAHLSLPELAQRLDDGLSALTSRRPGRHRTLRATIAWSHDLLDPEARRLLRRVSVFAGAFDLAGAGAVHGGDVTDPLTALVDHSMVVAVQHPDGTRYRLLETIRAFASERLAAAGEEATVRDHHVGVMTTWASSWPGVDGPVPAADLQEVVDRRADVRSAVGWAAARGRHAEVVTLTADLLWGAYALGWLEEPRGWAEDALDRAPDLDPELQVRGWYTVAWLAAAASDYPRADAAAANVVQLVAHRDDPRWRSRALEIRANAAWNTGDWDRASALYDELLPLQRRLGDIDEVAATLQAVGAVHFRRGRYDRTAAILAEATALYRAEGREMPDWAHYDAGILANRLGDHDLADEHLQACLRGGEAYGLATSVGASQRDLAAVRVNRGDLDEAMTLASDSIAHHRRSGDRWGEAASLQVLAHARVLDGDLGAAASDAAASLALFERLGDAWGAVGSRTLLGRATADEPTARAVLDRAVEDAKRVGDPWLLAAALDAVADRSAVEVARRAVERADAIRARIGVELPPSERAAHARRHARLAQAPTGSSPGRPSR